MHHGVVALATNKLLSEEARNTFVAAVVAVFTVLLH